jgi:nucleoside-diphosphate-sugar epimerase
VCRARRTSILALQCVQTLYFETEVLSLQRVLVTGATGFVGRHLVESLLREGRDVVVAVRDPARLPNFSRAVQTITFALERADAIGAASLAEVDCIYHLAAHVHVMHAAQADEERFLALNRDATAVLASCAATAGVRRFIYLSSIKVNGERTIDRPFMSSDVPAPVDVYGRSKLAAERTLAGIAASSRLEVVIVRPPLVYGPHVGANFRRLVSLVDSGLPLPLGAVVNRRSLVNVWNLVSLLVQAETHANAPGRTWLVSDGFDLSVPELLSVIGAALGRSTRLWSVPIPMLKTAGWLAGRRGEVARLVDSLQVDISETCNSLDWRPTVTTTEAIARTVAWFKATKHAS